MSVVGKVFRYLAPLWTGEDGKISGKNVAALCLVYNFIENLNYAVQKWDAGRSLEGLSLIMGIEAGLITALWGLTAWSNMTAKRIDTEALSPHPTPSSPVIVQKAENVVSGPTTNTKAETVNTENIDTVHTNTTNTNVDPNKAGKTE